MTISLLQSQMDPDSFWNFYPIKYLMRAFSRKVNKRQKEMYEIKTWEKRFINQKASSVLVSFELLGHDWCELSRSPEWKQVEKFLSQKKRNQNM